MKIIHGTTSFKQQKLHPMIILGLITEDLCHRQNGMISPTLISYSHKGLMQMIPRSKIIRVEHILLLLRRICLKLALIAKLPSTGHSNFYSLWMPTPCPLTI